MSDETDRPSTWYTREEARACVGPGWRDLIDRCWDICNENDVYITQVKEKFGGLRFYVAAATDEVFDVIEAAEAESLTICEDCGVPGRPRTERIWIRTLCDKCAEPKEKK
jgi:hypothetical protein